MATKVGINGFGRIGRLTLRALLETSTDDIEVVAVNDITDPQTNAHLFRYDSTYGRFNGSAQFDEDEIVINGQRIRSFKSPDPASIDWNSVGTEVVVEATGRFTDRETAGQHLGGSVKKVVISAPAKGEDVTLVLGVNDDAYDPLQHHVVSNASCTTNCLAPMAKVLLDSFGIERGLMTTIHSYTNDQKVQDQAHKDLRRARAAAQNIIPTSTGAAKAIGLVVPALKGKMHGYALRVPTPTVSVVDLVVTTEKDVTAEAINDAMRQAASGPMKGILQVCDDPLVSTDFIKDPHSCSLDSALTMAMGPRFAKVVGWYDNEWGYAMRVVDLIRFMASKGL
ncbi:MAG: Glyceraldehyde-3-phosphate dehydrogenase [Fimbriimonadales bacterium]|nr:MAG: type I glyceraldehyde-3-phosphate dehydrogenase [Armatimonadota bacterium]MBV6502885.1 Glyceraldehyde-3-phosphate dehydrogenase [Fimbriimonadales bacterium]MCE7899241.1 type I glyceraldehyde-3-phosphate dehydrogenase [Armatimonadetes bacterium ATM1]MDL1927814.1 type I glyceraldehyde-3-phosphate dehydrogenase [Fimbriimonadia bacterium ATM]MBC6969421.1 type I glyceraldehyde-3-phosphate dehydrogenase [Armatimonadota bacterium]